MSRLRTPPTENRDNDSVSKTPPAMPERVLTLQQRAFRELQNDNMRLNNDIDSLSEQVSKCNEDRNKVTRELKVLEREYANLNRRIVNLRNQFVITKWKSRVERSRAIREMEKLDSEAKASRRKFIELKRREVARKQAEADQRQSEETRGKIWDGTKWVTKGAAEVLGSVAAGLIGGVVGVGLGGAMAGYDYIKGKSKAEEKDDKTNRRAATRKVPATPAGSPPKQPLDSMKEKDDSMKEKDDWEEDNGTEWDQDTVTANLRAALRKDTSTPAPRGVPYRQAPRFQTPAQTPTPRVVQKTPRFQTPAGPPPKRSLDSVQEENDDDEMRERIIEAMKGKSKTQGGLNLPAIKKILIEDGMDKQRVNKMKSKEAREALRNIL